MTAASATRISARAERHVRVPCGTYVGLPESGLCPRPAGTDSGGLRGALPRAGFHQRPLVAFNDSRSPIQL